MTKEKHLEKTAVAYMFVNTLPFIFLIGVLTLPLNYHLASGVSRTDTIVSHTGV